MSGFERGEIVEINTESFKREYLYEWVENKGYMEAYKLWLWYNYHCESFDSKVCTGSNEYEEHMPASIDEHRLINKNSYQNFQYIQAKRKSLNREGVNINDKDWQAAKSHFSRYKLKALEEEYKKYFNIE